MSSFMLATLPPHYRAKALADNLFDDDDDDQRMKAVATFLLPCKVVQSSLDTQLRCLPVLQAKEGEMLSVWAFFLHI